MNLRRLRWRGRPRPTPGEPSYPLSWAVRGHRALRLQRRGLCPPDRLLERGLRVALPGPRLQIADCQPVTFVRTAG